MSRYRQYEGGPAYETAVQWFWSSWPTYNITLKGRGKVLEFLALDISPTGLAIRIADVFLFNWYGHVMGALWEVDDRAASTKNFYKI